MPMVVSDSRCNTQSEFSDSKQCREEENPAKHSFSEKKKRRKKKTDESNEQPQVEVCPNPVVELVIPQEENAETTAEISNPTPKKKKKKTKNVQDAVQLRTCDPSIAIGVEPDVLKEEGAQGDANGAEGLCHKPLLDTPTLIPQEENPETYTQIPSPTPKKKKKTKNVQDAEQLQIHDPSTAIGVEPDVTKEEGGSQEDDANGNEGLCPKPLLDTPIPINAETSTQNPNPTPRNKKKKKDKNVQDAEQLQTHDPSIAISVEPDVREGGSQEGDANGNGGLCPKPLLLETPIPIVPQEENAEASTRNPSSTPKKKKKTKNVQDAEQPQTCDLSIMMGVEPDVRKEEGGQQGSQTVETTTQNPDPTTKKKKKKKDVQDAQQQLQTCDSTIPIGGESGVTKEEGARLGSETAETETTTQNLDPTPKKKKKKKDVQGAQQQLQTCDPSIPISGEPGVKKEEGAQQGSETAETETTTPNPDPAPKKKKKKKDAQGSQQQLQTCDPSILIGGEPGVTKEEGAQQGDANETAVPGIHEERPVPDSTPPEDIPRKKKSAGKKKNVLKPQGAEPKPKSKESDYTEHPSITISVEPNVTKVEAAQQGVANETAVPGIHEERPVPDSTTPEDTPRKKKSTGKKKIVLKPQGAEPEPESKESDYTEHPSITISVEPNVTKVEAAQQGVANETVVLGINEECPVPDSTPQEDTAWKKKLTGKKKIVLKPQGAEPKPESKESDYTEHPSITISVEPDVMKVEAAQQGVANETAVLGINEECPVPDSTPQEDTPRKKKLTGKKKIVLKPQGAKHKPESKESDYIEHPSQSELKMKMKKGSEANTEYSGVCPNPESVTPLNIAIPNDSEVNKRLEPTEAKVENPQACSKPELASPIDLPAPKIPEKKEEAEPIKNTEAPAQTPQPQPCSAPIAEPPGDPTTPVDQSRRKRKSKRGKEKIMCSEEKVENQGSPLNMDITLNQAPDQVQQDQATPICLQPASLTDQAIPVDPATPIDPEQTMKKKKKQRKNALEGGEPNGNKHITELPEFSIQTSTCLIEAPIIDPAISMDPCLAIPICPAISTDPEQETSKKKRKRKKMSEGAEPNEHDVKPPETPVQSIVYPIVATSIVPTIPVLAPPIDQCQKTSTKRRKMSDNIIIKGAEPNEHDGKPPGTPVQISTYPIAEPSIDPTIPTSQAPLVDPEQMTKKKGKRKRNSAPKIEGLESENHNADPTAETPVQKTEGSASENSMDKYNAKQAAKTPLQRSNSLRVTKSPFKQDGESSLRCRACRQLGHKFQQCHRLKHLSKNEEVCFYCGEIGHSLGKCDVSQAGGFAKCLLCYKHGHFSYNCPQSGHGIDPKVLAVNGAINRTVEAQGEPLAEV